MDNYEQLNYLSQLDPEQDLIENTAQLIKFEYQKLKISDPAKVRNKHEGYGIASESFAVLNSKFKDIASEMKIFLMMLPSLESDTINVCSTLYNQATAVAVQAINMATQAQRIIGDLYYHDTKPNTYPLDEHLGSVEFSETEEPSVEDEVLEILDEAINDDDLGGIE